MTCYFQIDNINGVPPFEVTVCDNNNNNCTLMSYTFEPVPPTIYVTLPEDWSQLPFFFINVKDSNNCIQTQLIPQ
jgi:hypothetical protein